jgi:hypothetical protein
MSAHQGGPLWSSHTGFIGTRQALGQGQPLLSTTSYTEITIRLSFPSK